MTRATGHRGSEASSRGAGRRACRCCSCPSDGAAARQPSRRSLLRALCRRIGPYLTIHSCAAVMVFETQLLSFPIVTFRMAGTSELNIVSDLSLPAWSSRAIASAFEKVWLPTIISWNRPCFRMVLPISRRAGSRVREAGLGEPEVGVVVLLFIASQFTVATLLPLPSETPSLSCVFVGSHVGRCRCGIRRYLNEHFVFTTTGASCQTHRIRPDSCRRGSRTVIPRMCKRA